MKWQFSKLRSGSLPESIGHRFRTIDEATRDVAGIGEGARGSRATTTNIHVQALTCLSVVPAPSAHDSLGRRVQKMVMATAGWV